MALMQDMLGYSSICHSTYTGCDSYGFSTWPFHNTATPYNRKDTSIGPYSPLTLHKSRKIRTQEMDIKCNIPHVVSPQSKRITSYYRRLEMRAPPASASRLSNKPQANSLRLTEAKKLNHQQRCNVIGQVKYTQLTQLPANYHAQADVRFLCTCQPAIKYKPIRCTDLVYLKLQKYPRIVITLRLIVMVKQIEASMLAKRLEMAEDKVLVLDTRSVAQYNAGFIGGSVHICCSGVILRRLKNGSLKVGCLLNCPEDKSKYEQAQTSESVSVIVCDQNTQNVDSLSSDSIAAMLLKKVCRECKSVAFLSGGLTNFTRRYPQMCVLSQADRSDPLKKRPSSLVLQITNLSLSVQQQNNNDTLLSTPEDDSPVPKDLAPFHILPHLSLGCRKIASCLPSLRESNISRILNVTSSVPNQFQDLDGFTYKQIAVEDSHEVDMLQHFPEAFSFIEDARMKGERVLVHCHAGMSRSVTIILAYLMKFYQHTLSSAYDFVKQKKSNISPNFSFMGQLLEYETLVHGSQEQPSPSDSGFGSSVTTPLDGHCFLSPVESDLSRACILAA